MSEAAVKVAVRLRPFNDREKKRQAQLIVRMFDKTTTVMNPDNEDEEFTYNFDYSLFSHDPSKDNFVTQQNVYDSIGKDLLHQFWIERFNVCMFAYGQSGAGKSFSMTGVRTVPDLAGIIPRICNDVLSNCVEETTETTTFVVTVGMLEIYLGVIQDLLIDRKKRPKGGLPIYGNAAKGLTRIPCTQTEEIMTLLEKGQSNQTVAATGLNAVSSRGHTLFELTLTKTIKNPGSKKITMGSTMKLIDLAGSEKLDKVRELAGRISAKEMAAREEEGKCINNSLTALGQCISKVAKASNIEDKKKRKKALSQIAWRQATLTHLLRESLGGNCKTIMIAAVSPAHTEYQETRSTLRYANEVKKIKGTAKKGKINGTPEQLALMAAQEKIAQLEKMLKGFQENGGGGGGGDGDGGGGGGGGGGGANAAALQAALDQMKAEQAAEMKRMEEENEKQRQAMEEMMAERRARDAAKLDFHLIKVVDDPSMTGLFVEPIRLGETVAGEDDESDIILTGMRVLPKHCAFIHEADQPVQIIPEKDSVVLVNGTVVEEPRPLAHNDRVVLGQANFFVFKDPEVLKGQQPDEVEADNQKYSYNTVRKEAMAEVLSKFSISLEDEETAKARLQAQLKAREEQLAREQQEMAKKAEADRQQYQQQLLALKKAKEEAAAGSAHEKALMAKLEKEQAEFQKKMLEQKQELEKRLKEEEEYKQRLLKKEENRRDAQEQNQHEMENILIDLIPSVINANNMANDLQVPAKYSVRLISTRTLAGYLKTDVFVEVEWHDLKARWSFLKFNEKFGSMKQLHQDWNDADRKIGKKLKQTLLDEDTNPFVVNSDTDVLIGEVMAGLQFVYCCMPLEDRYTVIDFMGSSCGQLWVKVDPFLEPFGEQALLVDDISQLKEANTLDLRLSINSVTNLPPEWASNVYCSISFPEFVETELVEMDVWNAEQEKRRALEKEAKEAQRKKKKKRKKKKRGGGEGEEGEEDLSELDEEDLKEGEEEDDDAAVEGDDDDDDFWKDPTGGSGMKGRLGATYITPTDTEERPDGKLTVNVEFGFERVVRIHNANDPQVLAWLKEDFVSFKVWGAAPVSEEQMKRRKKARARAKREAREAAEKEKREAKAREVRRRERQRKLDELREAQKKMLAAHNEGRDPDSALSLDDVLSGAGSAELMAIERQRVLLMGDGGEGDDMDGLFEDLLDDEDDEALDMAALLGGGDHIEPEEQIRLLKEANGKLQQKVQKTQEVSKGKIQEIDLQRREQKLAIADLEDKIKVLEAKAEVAASPSSRNGGGGGGGKAKINGGLPDVNEDGDDAVVGNGSEADARLLKDIKDQEAEIARLKELLRKARAKKSSACTIL